MDGGAMRGKRGGGEDGGRHGGDRGGGEGGRDAAQFGERDVRREGVLDDRDERFGLDILQDLEESGLSELYRQEDCSTHVSTNLPDVERVTEVLSRRSPDDSHALPTLIPRVRIEVVREEDRY